MEKKYRKTSRSFRIVVFFWMANLFAQGPDTLWTRTYGGTNEDRGYSVQQTSDGGYIIAGYTSSFGVGKNDIYLIKTDANGDTLWTKIYGGTDYDVGRSVQQTSDSGYIIAGYTSSFGVGKNDIYLIKTDAKGDTFWTRTYGGADDDYGNSVQETSDGGYIITGKTESFGAESSDVYLIKTDAKGDTLWTKTYGGTDKDGGESVQQTSDGGYIIAGWTYSFGAGKSDVYFIKTDTKGDTFWTKTYGGTDYDRGYSVQQTSDGGYIIAGVTSSFGASWGDVYLIKTDASGDTIWTKTYGGTDYDRGYSVQQTSDEGYIIAGWTGSFGVGAGSGYVYLIKTDANGDSLWTRIYGGTSGDEGYSVQQTSDGGYIVVGESRGDVYLIKTKPDVGIKENAKCKVQNAKLDVCPNPFNQMTVISYQLPAKTVVSLKVYDISGKLVKILTRVQNQEPRVYTVVWDGRNNTGENLPSGVYFLRFEVGKYNATRKLLIMR